MFVTSNREPTGDIPVLLELCGQLCQTFGPGELVVTEHPNRPPGFLQAGLAQVMGTIDGIGKPGVARILGGQHPGFFELEQEPGEGMGKHVMHLPGQPLAFGHSCRLSLNGSALP